MGKKVFVSYSHKQGDWVWDRLVPCLKSGGAEVKIDHKRFRLGLALFSQMDALQDEAEASLLVLSPAYLASTACLHEMERAVALDPAFTLGKVIPVVREACTLPAALATPNPLYADLQDDSNAATWDRLLQAAGADLGAAVPDWLAARDEVRRLLERGQSVNILVQGNGCKWRELLEHLRDDHFPQLGVVNLEQPATASRRGLIEEVLARLGARQPVPAAPEDLVALDRALQAGPSRQLAFSHFDLAAHREHYGVDLFAALRYLVMDSRKLVLLLQSRRPFASLLPAGHPLSEINLQTVELKGRP